MRARSTYLPVRFRRPQRGYEASGMAIRLFPLAVIVILALSGLGLWITETDVLDESAAGAVYLVTAGIALVIVITAGVVLTVKRWGPTRLDRYRAD